MLDAVDLAEPLLGGGASVPGSQVDLDLVQARQHVGADLEHRAADAGESVPRPQDRTTWRPGRVRPAAGSRSCSCLGVTTAS